MSSLGTTQDRPTGVRDSVSLPMTRDDPTERLHAMTFPTVIEKPAQLEAVVRDTFIDVDAEAAAERSASWAWPRRRPADA